MASTRADEKLRREVLQSLCEAENLLPNEYELSEIPLVRGKRPCGTQFILHGPRSVRLGAVWDAERDVLYLYDATGQRYEKRRLARERRAA